VERLVKERLIGAAVLVAAAVILIPEMLSGRGDRATSSEAATVAAGEAPLKTYTIDLSKSPTGDPDTLRTAAPPPESAPDESQSAPAAESFPESGDASDVAEPPPATESPATESTAPTTSAQPDAPAARPTTPQPSVAKPPPPAATERKPSSGGWAVQLGSFSSRTTADNLAGKMRGTGYDAFVMPVKSAGTTLYRVRIGPMPDRQTAANALNKIKTQVPAAAVVKHP